MDNLNNNNHNYNAENIQVLEGLEAVRKRPGMYIGSTGERGLHHLVWEIVDNAIDESMVGYASEITLEILPDNIIKVTDDGRGIPVDKHAKTGKSAVETILTVLHAGGKFDGKSYKVSGGLHGVGASVVNALTDWFRVTIARNGLLYQQEYSKGVPQYELKVIGESVHTGTTIEFKADHSIFTEAHVYDFELLRNRIQELAFLNRHIKISITDSRGIEPVSFTYQYEGGIEEYVAFINSNKNKINSHVFYTSKEVDDITVEVSLQYNDSYATNLYSFANNIHTHEGGMHEDG
ncbi:MAG: DNA topoisomerase IV subunit B, partial [Tenericutes bacterium HGW-Tenericutes-8]